MKKFSKVLKASVLVVFAALVIAGPVFADDCTTKFPNLSTSKDDDHPVKCPKITIGGKSKQYYGKKSGDCAQVSSIASNPDSCKNTSDLNSVIQIIINTIIFVIGMVAVVMIILGGISYATSQGDPAKVKKGKDTILYGIIGLVVALLAFAIVNFVLGAFNG